jgi:hypothetical protein
MECKIAGKETSWRHSLNLVANRGVKFFTSSNFQSRNILINTQKGMCVEDIFEEWDDSKVMDMEEI